MIAVFSRGMMRSIPQLSTLLGAEICFRPRRPAPDLRAVAGWGAKPSTARARAFAEHHGLPFLAIEDGFLRSVEPGGRGAPPLSIVVDDLGIYYDAQRASRLEALIAAPLATGQAARTRDLVQRWRQGRLSKYNHAREQAAQLAEPFVLVVDQTWGDASIRHGLADEASFQRMLQAALAEHPDKQILLKVHPDVVAGRKRGHFAGSAGALPARVRLLAQDSHPAALIEHSAAVYVVTSQMGFEALLWGKPVRTFGMPFYAGWGQTADELAAPTRRGPASLEALVHAALVAYPRYLDPETGERCEVERVMEHLALQRQMRERFPAQVYALNFSYWKKPIVRRFFQGSHVRFVQRVDAVPDGATLAIWGAQTPTTRAVHLEDGFLRSAGLGVDLVEPSSWVMDRRGIYYDPAQPSDLEVLLQEQRFDEHLLERARRLRAAIVARQITKYNVGGEHWQRPAGTAPVILVPGQVEADASIRLGAPQIHTNNGLLQAVRTANPHAYVVYKPHPDVLARMRAGGAPALDSAPHCNAVVGDVSMARLLEEVDEVHTLTSLAGFEALLRGKRVVTYGQPFYAGWGLTVDHLSPPRRTRRLSLDELVAGALILYPSYISRTTGHFTTPERILLELSQRQVAGGGRRLFMRQVRRLVYWLTGKQA
jgi:capsular polysaccharide export protein